MEMSISAVVFLILGIALLGGGLMFIRTLTAKTNSGVASIMKSGDLDKKADSYTPLVVDREISIKETETKMIDIAFYCNKPSGEVCGPGGPMSTSTALVRPFFAEDTSNSAANSECKGLDENGEEIPLLISSTDAVNFGISMSSVATKVDAHENIGFRVILNSKKAPPGKYNCNIIVAKSELVSGIDEYLELDGEIYASQQVFINVI